MRIWLLLFALVTGLSGPVSAGPRAVSVEVTGEGQALVVVLGGSEGGMPRYPALTSALHAKRLRVVHLGYFGFSGGPRHLSEIDLDPIAQAIRAQAPDRACIGVIGVSKGAELALMLAAHRDLSAATVAVVPSHVVWQSSKVALTARSSWVMDGQPVPFVPYTMLSRHALAAARDPNQAMPLHQQALRNSRAVDRARIPVEQIRQPVLVQGALRDQIWPSAQMAQAILERVGQMRPSHGIMLKQYDHDHYLLQSPQARRDIVTFMGRHLGGCRAQ